MKEEPDMVLKKTTKGEDKDEDRESGFSKLMVDQNIIEPQIIKEKITAALTILSFREPRVLVQFWSPVAVGKRCLLMTMDQPFGFGVADEGLYSYRLESEQRMFALDGDYDETELGPSGRVYQKKWPEWSLDIHDWAARYNIHGYIDLPVFEPSSGSCVGVLELITSSNYDDYAFEVQEVSRALKKENLKSPNVLEDPSFHVGDGRRLHELDEIFRALKMVCEIQKLPLAQMWAPSKYSSFVANSGNLEKICNSFNKNCIGKACMSTAALPFYVRDLSMWGFHEACREQHLEKSQGLVGRSLSSRGSCFCRDVTKLGEDEYPLVPMARLYGITSCLAIYLKSLQVYGEYVIELFFPSHTANKVGLQSLVETVKQQIKNASGVQLGIMSSAQVIGGVPLNWNLESPPLTENGEAPPEPENLQLITENEQTDADVILTQQRKSTSVEHLEEYNEENETSNSAAAGTSQSVVPCLEKGTEDFDINSGRTRRKGSDISNVRSRKRKRTVTIGLEDISKLYGKTMEEAAVGLRVSRSTLKRICRSLGILRWPYSKDPCESDSLLNLNQTDVVIHASEGTPTPIFEPSNEPSGTTDRTHDTATLTNHGKHSSTLVFQQQEQTYLPNGCAVPETTIRRTFMKKLSANTLENVTIKATYRENTVKFPFNLLDGLVRLEELVATRFQLRLGSFNLKYIDQEGEMILVACESDLPGALCASRQPNVKTVIRLLVWPVALMGTLYA